MGHAAKFTPKYLNHNKYFMHISCHVSRSGKLKMEHYAMNVIGNIYSQSAATALTLSIPVLQISSSLYCIIHYIVLASFTSQTPAVPIYL